MPTRTRHSLTRAIQKIVHRQPLPKKSAFAEKSDFSIRPLAASPALLSLVLLSQPALAQDPFNTQFEKVPRLENPLKPPIDVGNNSKPAFVDIDNDGDLDVFIGANDGTVKYYENTGTVSNPIFEERTEQKYPVNGVDVGNDSAPTLVDIDGDEDLDTFIGTSDGTIKYYENTGTANQPTFVERTKQQNPFNGMDIDGNESFGNSVPFFVDIDGDGDLDAFIGTNEGTVKYYENTGTAASQPTFVERTEHPFNGVDVGNASVPYFADIDNDTYLDAFMGAGDGTVKYYENTSTSNELHFVERTEQNNPLHGVDVGDNSAPALIDIDNDSDLDAFIGASNGTVKYYENTGTPHSPRFEQRTNLNNPFGGLIDAEITLALADIDNDGDKDAFTGTSDGQVKYYENTGNVNQPRFVERTKQNNPLNGVEMKSDSLPTFVDIDNDGDLDAFIGGKVEVRDEDGNISTDYLKYYENTGTARRPLFDERTTTNPLNELEVSSTPDLSFVDIDYDRDFDLIIQTSSTIMYYENTRSVSQPHFVKRTEQKNPFVNIREGRILAVADIDNDGNLEAIVRANSRIVKYYEYEYTGVGNPKFVDRTNEQNDLIADVQVGNNSNLTLVDIDNDGYLDAFIKAPDGRVKYYKNTSKQEEVINPPSSPTQISYPDTVPFSQPTLVDIDDDKDLDAFIGAYDGTVIYYENTGTASQPFFKRTVLNNPFANVKVESKSQPSLVDIDGDGDLDSFIGAKDGTVSYYENTGTARQPHFVKRTGPNNPLADVDVGFDSSPTLVDIDNDRDLEAFIGAMDGTVTYYENTGTEFQPEFVEHTEQNNPFANVDVGLNSIPTLVDIDNDHDLDAVIKNGNGTVTYYENIGSTVWFPNIGGSTVWRHNFVPTKPNLISSLDVVDYDSILALVDIGNDNDLDAFIEITGSVIYYENQGNASSPNLVKRTEQNSPFKIESPRFDKQLPSDNVEGGSASEQEDSKTYYYDNISLAINTLPNPYALPRSGTYNSPRQVSLNCIDCEKIYYTLEGSTPTKASTKYVDPIEITQNTTLKFAVLDDDAQGTTLNTVQTEQYVIDTTLPEIKIDSPANNSTFKAMPSLKGTAIDEPEDGVGLDRIELKVNYEPLYISGEGDIPFTTSLTWLRIDDNTTTRNWSYDLGQVVPIIPTGDYDITVRAFDKAGNFAEDSISVTIGEPAHTELFIELSGRAILNNDTLNVTGKLNRLPESDQDLAGLPIQLTITAPDGTTRTETTETYSNTGQYQFLNRSGFTQKGKYTFKTTFAGGSLLEEAESTQESVLVGESAGYAIIVQGKIANEEGLEAHNKTTNRIYKTLRERNFEADNLYYFNYNRNQTEVEVDDIPSRAAIKAAFDELADKMNGSPAPFYLIMVDHGGKDGHFYLGSEEITPKDISDWLTTLESRLTNKDALAKPRFVILGYCYSGSFIPALSGLNRVIITSAAANEVSYKGPKEPDDIRTGEFFMEELFQRLRRGASFQQAFEKATEFTEIYTRSGSSANPANPYYDDAVQHPLLDRNGDKHGSNDLQTEPGDGPNLAELYLGTGAELITNADSAAEIRRVTETKYLTSEESSADLFIEVNNANRVNRAPVDIRTPSTTLTTDELKEYTEQREIEGIQRVAGDLECDNLIDYCDKSVNVFDEPGKYELFYFVRDRDTLDISPIKRSVVYKNKPNNQPPNSFKLLYPTNGASTRTALRFDWETTTDPDSDAVTYTFLIATDPEKFDNSVVYKQEERPIPVTTLDNNTVINDGRTDGTTGLKDLTTYYWKVEAIDNFGTRTTSPVFSFQTDNFENGGFNPIDNNCDSTLENNNHCATFSSDVQILHIPAANAFELGWYKGDLHQTTDNIFTVYNLEPIRPVQRPTGNEALYYPTTGKLLIRSVEIERNGIKYEYRATMRLISNIDPLQFKFINEDIIPLWNR
jgi:hypothetical protein